MIETDEILTEDGTQYMKRVVESTYYKTGERDEMDCKMWSRGVLIHYQIIKHYIDGKQPTVKVIINKTKKFKFPELDTEKEGVISYLRDKKYIKATEGLTALKSLTTKTKLEAKK